MGSWGVGLYQDDTAVDLKGMIAALADLPASGERLLEIVMEHHEEGVTLDDDGGPTFWLVVADQFERRGIVCPLAFERALMAIDTDADLRDLERRGASPADLRKRANILRTIAGRLRSPRPPSTRPKKVRFPPFVVEVGEVYGFPTMRHEAFNPWFPSWARAGFEPDGWGAMLIVARGRVFDWFPWYAASSLTVDPSVEPSLQDAVRARFIFGEQSGHYLAPRRSHLKRMAMRLLGRLNLDPAATAHALPREGSPQEAVINEGTFAPEARAWRGTGESGIAVADLVASR